MQKKNKKYLYMSIGFIMSFVIWTMLIQIIDVKAIGPWGSEVGLATINGYIHKLIGVAHDTEDSLIDAHNHQL